MPKNQPAAKLSSDLLLRLAGDATFGRGTRYAADGHVASLAQDGLCITATVHGTRRYRVTLTTGKRELQHSCTCPVGEDGGFCKHCVAVGLAWLGDAAKSPTGTGRRRSRAVTMKDVRAHLATLGKDALVDLLIQQAMSDDRLQQQLLLETAQLIGGSENVDTFRAAYEEAVQRLRDVKRAMKSLPAAQRSEYFASVHVRHKAKRNFIKLLNAAKF